MVAAMRLHDNTVFVRIEGQNTMYRYLWPTAVGSVSMNTNNPIKYNWVAAMAYKLVIIQY